MAEFPLVRLKVNMSALVDCTVNAMNPMHAITTAHFVTFIIFIVLNSLLVMGNRGESFSKLHLESQVHLVHLAVSCHALRPFDVKGRESELAADARRIRRASVPLQFAWRYSGSECSRGRRRCSTAPERSGIS